MDCGDADVFTYGFSNREWNETIEILAAFKIERLVDIRSMPGSRKFPQFNKETLEIALPDSGIEYMHLAALGGRRKKTSSGEENAGWRSDAFRNYADYMQTQAFHDGIEQLIAWFKEKRTVYVCTEAVYWRCHRSLVSDALWARGFKPGHIFTAKKCEMHRPTKFARFQGETVTYPVDTAQSIS